MRRKVDSTLLVGLLFATLTQAGVVVLLLATFTQARAQLKFETVEQENDPSFCFAISIRQTDASCTHSTPCILSFAAGQDLYMLHVGRNETQLIWYSRDRKRVIAQGKGLGNGNSWRLLLVREPDSIRLLSNGEQLMRAMVRIPSGGAFKYALGCPHISAEEIRYQPTEPVFFADDFTQGDDNLTSWDRTGQWALQGVDSPQPNPNLSANPFALCAIVSPQKNATALTGYWFWHSYAAQASVKVQGNAVAGLIAYADGLKSYWLLTLEPQGNWRYNPQGTIRLTWVKDGKREVIAEKKMPIEYDQWYELRINASEGTVRGWVDGIEVVRANITAFPMGQVGLYAEGDGRVYFDDVIVAPLQQLLLATARTKITEQYTHEDTMADWATFYGSFMKDAQDPNLLWHQGAFFGDFELIIWLSDEGRGKGSFTFYLCPMQISGARPIAIRFIRRSERPRQIANLRIGLPTPLPFNINAPISVGGINDVLISIEYGSQTLKSAKVSLDDIKEAPVRLLRLSNRLVVMHGNKVIASTEHPAVAYARFISYRSDGYQPDWNRCDLICSNLIDETFSIAPTRWRSTRGVWQVTARWPCSPGWAWFGGTQHRFPTLWSKGSFEGNMVIEVFAAIKMKERGNPYPNPRDINVSFCADGWNVGSGYSFLLAGWKNSASGLFRKGTLIATNPDFVFKRVSTLNFAGFHRHWFHIRIVKFGGHIACYVDRQLAVQWQDPQPLNSGRVAIWTVDNGVLIARARIWYEKLNALETAPMPPSNLPQVMPTANQDVNGWKPILSEESEVVVQRNIANKVEVINCMPGGRMLVRAPVRDMNVTKSTKLKLAIRVGEGTLVNLYLRLNGKTVAIPLSSQLEHQDDVMVLTPNTNGVQITKTANGAFKVDIDVSALCEAIGLRGNVTLNDVFIGNLADNEYLLAGLLGNHLGNSYTIEEFSVTN